MTDAPGPYDGPAGDFVCPVCDKAFDSQPKLTGHIRFSRDSAHTDHRAAEGLAGPPALKSAAAGEDNEATNGKAGAGDRLRGLFGGTKGDGAAKEKAPKVKKTTARGPRAKLDQFGTGAMELAAWLANRRGNYPLGRIFSLEAPAFGPALEDAAKGTVADRMLQPIARLGGRGTRLARLAALPGSAAAFMAQPSAMTQAIFVGALEAALPDIIESAELAARKQEKVERDLARFAYLFGKEPGESVTIEDVAGWIFSPGPIIDANSAPAGPEPGSGPVREARAQEVA